MVYLHAPKLALAMAMTATAASARSVPGPSLWEGSNGTTQSTEPGLLDDQEIIYSFCGVDLVGGDLWNAQGNSPDDCMGPCRPESGCDAATWTNYNGGTCWFKQLRWSWASAVPTVGAASFLRRPLNTGGYNGPLGLPAGNNDMPGNDLMNVQVPASECRRRCITNAYCFAYSWTDYNGGTCWLKSKASPFVYSPGTTSDFTGRVTNPNTCLAHM